MNAVGLYTLAELRILVLRKVDLYRQTIDQTNGQETGDPVYSQEISNQDLNMFINTAVTKLYVDMISEDLYVFADEHPIDVRQDVQEYELPPDLAILRRLQWKYPSTPYLVQPFSPRVEMNVVDEADGPDVDNNGVSTYKRRLNLIHLNKAPTEDNKGGIVVDYVKWILPLLNDNQVIETQFARIFQEAVILDAAIEVVSQRLHIDASELRATKQEVLQRVGLLIRNSSAPPTIKLVLREHPVLARRDG